MPATNPFKRLKRPPHTGSAVQVSGETRYTRYLCGAIICLFGLFIMSFGAVLPRNADLNWVRKYREKIIMDGPSDPDYAEFSAEPTRGFFWGGNAPTDEDDGQPISFYVQSITNYNRHVQGAKAIVSQRGPFVFRKYTHRHFAEFSGRHAQNIRYKPREFYVGDSLQSTSLFTVNDRIIVPNPGWELLRREWQDMFPEYVQEPEDVLIPWFSAVVFRVLLVQSVQKYRQIWFYEATSTRFMASLRRFYSGSTIQMGVAWAHGNVQARDRLAELDLKGLPREEWWFEPVAARLWNRGQIMSFTHPFGNELALLAVQERIIDGEFGSDYERYVQAYQTEFRNIDTRYASLALVRKHVNLIMDWLELFLVPSSVGGPHAEYLEGYILDRYYEFGVLPKDAVFEDLIGIGMGENAVLGIFVQRQATVDKAVELEEFAYFIENYNSTGNLTVPLEEALPLPKVFNDTSRFSGITLNNTCPEGASLVDTDGAKSTLFRGFPEFSCWTTGPAAPSLSFQSKVSGKVMGQLFGLFSGHKALFGVHKPTMFINKGVNTRDKRGSFFIMKFFKEGRELLHQENSTFSEFGQRIADAARFYIAQYPDTHNATVAYEAYRALVEHPEVVSMNHRCQERMVSLQFGNLTCLQVHDLMAWMEDIALNWVWRPEFVWKSKTGTGVDTGALNAGPFLRVSIRELLFTGFTDNLVSSYTSSPENPNGILTPPLLDHQPSESAFLASVEDAPFREEFDSGRINMEKVNQMVRYNGEEELTVWGETTPVRGTVNLAQFRPVLQRRHRLGTDLQTWYEVFSFDMLRPVNYTLELVSANSHKSGLDRGPDLLRYRFKDPVSSFDHYQTDLDDDIGRCEVSLRPLNRGLSFSYSKPYLLNCNESIRAQLPEMIGQFRELTEENFGSMFVTEHQTGTAVRGEERGGIFYRYVGSRWYPAMSTTFPTLWWETSFKLPDSFLDELQSDTDWTKLLVDIIYPFSFFLGGSLLILLGGCFFAWAVRDNGIPHTTGVQTYRDFPAEAGVARKKEKKDDDLVLV